MGWALSEPNQAAPDFPLVGLLLSLFTPCSLNVPHWGWLYFPPLLCAFSPGSQTFRRMECVCQPDAELLEGKTGFP